MAVAAASVVLVWLAVRAGRLNGPEPVVAVVLAANRGVLEAHAPAGRALLLVLDLEGLPEDPGAFRLEMIDSGRRSVWRGTAPNGRTARAAVPAMAPGVYFVRVSAAHGELLREYGLEVGKN
jgi:anti-sigma-K factor RskA